ncbi:hypothetical protein [Candidatus Hydrogenosomobacter endosymbioticus]|nr:hypothetical protein [Candidatus Hydrogenosomobacter endosymbioticus]
MTSSNLFAGQEKQEEEYKEEFPISTTEPDPAIERPIIKEEANAARKKLLQTALEELRSNKEKMEIKEGPVSQNNESSLEKIKESLEKDPLKQAYFNELNFFSEKALEFFTGALNAAKSAQPELKEKILQDVKKNMKIWEFQQSNQPYHDIVHLTKNAEIKELYRKIKKEIGKPTQNGATAINQKNHYLLQKNSKPFMINTLFMEMPKALAESKRKLSLAEQGRGAELNLEEMDNFIWNADKMISMLRNTTNPYLSKLYDKDAINSIQNQKEQMEYVIQSLETIIGTFEKIKEIVKKQ